MVTRRRRRGRWALLLLIGLLGAAATLRTMQRWWDAPLAALTGPTVLEIAPGERVGHIAERLARLGVLDYPRTWAWQARARGLASHIRAGEYELKAAASPGEVLALLVSGKVLLHPVTLVEGWTVAQALSAVHEQPFLKVSGTLPGGLQPLAGAHDSLEGLLFPDTYLVPKGTTDLEVLRLAQARLTAQLAAAWAARVPGLPYQRPYDALILASIIEKETGNPDERAHIAAVFINRLRRGMRLQTDPTVIYGMGARYAGTLRKKDLTTDTPWNTYTRVGLPPTPIALPGAASLAAALHPADADDLFFVATGSGDGRHTFSATLAAHNAAVAGYVARQRQKVQQR